MLENAPFSAVRMSESVMRPLAAAIANRRRRPLCLCVIPRGGWDRSAPLGARGLDPSHPIGMSSGFTTGDVTT